MHISREREKGEKSKRGEEEGERQKEKKVREEKERLTFSSRHRREKAGILVGQYNIMGMMGESQSPNV